MMNHQTQYDLTSEIESYINRHDVKDTLPADNQWVWTQLLNTDYKSVGFVNIYFQWQTSNTIQVICIVSLLFVSHAKFMTTPNELIKILSKPHNIQRKIRLFLLARTTVQEPDKFRFRLWEEDRFSAGHIQRYNNQWKREAGLIECGKMGKVKSTVQVRRKMVYGWSALFHTQVLSKHTIN